MPQTLEQITKRTFNQKYSFLQKIKNSLAGKLAILISAGAFAFADCGGENEKCIPTANIFCHENIVYSIDSCGDLGDILKHCSYSCGCKPDHSDCASPCCGNGQIEPQEECDGTNLGGRTCQSLGYDKGTLLCTADCKLNTANCSTDSPPEPPEITKEYSNGIPVQSGTTNQDGQILFTDEQTGEEVVVNVRDEPGNPLPGAHIAFFDGNGFEAFHAYHPDFTPYFHIFGHNSTKDLTLTSASMQFHHYNGTSNNNSYGAAENFVDWAKVVAEAVDNSYIGCITAEEANLRVEEGNYILNMMEKIPGVGQIVSITKDYTQQYYNVVSKLIEWGILDGGECAAFQKWYIVPPATQDNDNIRAALWYWECLSSIPPENCSDYIDNDCDGKIDSQDEDCQQPACTNDCAPSGLRQCFGNSWKECNNFDSDNCLEWSSLTACGTNRYCEDGECTSNCSPSTEICNSQDDDCDGQTDESLHQACYTSCGQGLEWCINGSWQNCNAPKPSTEVCDGRDNDCDNYVDEGCSCINGQTQQCGVTSTGECSYGTQTCSINGQWGNCVGNIDPVSEVCDSLDNNCNGLTDEGDLCGGSDCLEGICCYPYDHTACEMDPVTWAIDLYWVDSCGRIGEMAEDCPSDACVCESNNSGTTCYCHTPSQECYDPDWDGYGPYCLAGDDCDNGNANIHPGAAEILNGLDDNCNGQIDEGFVNTGNPQITLFWNNAADLDLHVYAPDGCHIYYGNENCGTGHLDRDANLNCNPGAETPPENIYWNEGQAPAGTYRVEVKYFKECSNSGPTSYTVSISRNGNVSYYNGTLNNENDATTVTSFNN